MGSFRLAAEFRIFTENSISLSRYRRQWRSRYAIHAGRNLPAKEFRYLRTVRVTAAVYLGFVRCFNLSLIFKAPGRPQTLYFMFCNFAKSCVFSKQSLPPFLAATSNLIAGPPYPEVTESICRVPSILLSHIALVYSTNSTCVGFQYGSSSFRFS